MKALSEHEVLDLLSDEMEGWILENNTIRRDLKFSSFVNAFAFMTAVALEAEKMNHHPDWSNGYNRVSISLSTHDANGITQNDFDLAKVINRINETFQQPLPAKVIP